MKKILAMMLALVMVLTLAACGNDAQNEKPEESKSPETSVQETPAPSSPEKTSSVKAGTYVYNEDKGNMGVVPWTVVLKEDGTCTVTESNPHMGEKPHESDTWTDNGDATFTTGAWIGGADGPKSDFFGDDGSATWKVVDEDTCEPVNGTPSLEGDALQEALANSSSNDTPSGPPSDGPTDAGGPPADGPVGPVEAGTYVYEEDKGSMGIIPWTVVLKEDGTCTVTENNPHMGEKVHESATWTDDGNGTFTTGAWIGGADGPKSDFFGDDGSATWKVTGDGTCAPVV